MPGKKLSHSRPPTWMMGVCGADREQTLELTLFIYTINIIREYGNFFNMYLNISKTLHIVKLRQGSGKDRQGMAVKAKGLKASTLA